jgi:cellulose synthase/poly-beta-1,6-N-acetylglucosamine synthase-like glycosyltransferase
VCWTDAPEDLATLKKQRIRWQRGLIEVLIKYRSLLFSRRSGTVGWVAYPFMIIVEAISPIMEVLGLIFTLLLYFFGYLNGPAALLFLFASVGMGLLLSTSAILLEERSFHVYPGYRTSIKLFLLAVIENFGYRQLNSWWRLWGTFQHFKGSESKWGDMKRNTGWISEDSKYLCLKCLALFDELNQRLNSR